VGPPELGALLRDAPPRVAGKLLSFCKTRGGIADFLDLRRPKTLALQN
jgi:hypothetical protein